MVRYLTLAIALCLAAAPQARPDDEDPEPRGGGGKLRELKGTWTVTRAIFAGREAKAPGGMTYAFDGNKLVRTTPFGKGANQTFEVKVEGGKKPYRITMTPEGGGRAQLGIFKIEKGELFIATGLSKDGKAPEDFNGTTGGVMVMTKEKK